MNALIGIIIYIALLTVAILFFIGIGKRNAKQARFDLMYENFKIMLNDPLRPINRTSWKHLNKCFDEIELLYKVNPEKADVLRGEFLKLYEPVTDEIEVEYKEMLSQDEYSASQIFSEYN